MNSKGRLQEWCQRSQRDLPIYETQRSGGPDHRPTFVSTVIVNQKRFTGFPEETKSSAEHSAAIVAYTELTSPIPSTPSVPPPVSPVPTVVPKWLDKKVKPLILIDLDNRQKGLEELADFVDRAEIIGFAGKLGSSAREGFYVPSGTKRIIINSAAKDAADIGMIVYLTRRLEQGFINPIYLLTGDHFGSTAKEILIDNYPNVKYFHCTTSGEVKNYF